MKKLCILLLLAITCVLVLSACNTHTHDFGEWTTVTAATCTEDGEAERTCACGETETKRIEAHHTEAVIQAVSATCVTNGWTEGKYCSACEEVLVVAQEIVAQGHKKVVTSKQILPTVDDKGMTEGAYCSSCREVLSEPEEIPARGYDRMLADGEFKVLLIGNSFTQDASNYAQNIESQLCSALGAMLGEDIKVTVGILVMGDRGLNWHATQAYNNVAACHLQVYTSDSLAWRSKGEMTHAEALAWTSWDAVSLQPYALNTATGVESNNFPAETHSRFLHIADSTAYLLDLVANNAPEAEVYCYMHWAASKDIVLDAGLNKYNQMAELYPTLLEYHGTETGKRFTTLVPVGLAIQNARTTYLALLKYNETAYLDGTLNYKTDGQIGLQRDQGHLSYNVGRYIAALTFAEMLIPEKLRAEGYTLPDIRKTESIGVLPLEYSIIAQSAVLEAVESWKQGSLAVTEIGYEKDPTTLFAEAFADGLTVNRNQTADRIKKAVENALKAAAAADLVIEEIKFPESITAGQSFTVTVTVRFGYTTLSFTVDCVF